MDATDEIAQLKAQLATKDAVMEARAHTVVSSIQIQSQPPTALL